VARKRRGDIEEEVLFYALIAVMLGGSGSRRFLYDTSNLSRMAGRISLWQVKSDTSSNCNVKSMNIGVLASFGA
jgi:hypothetical protein